MNRKQFITTLTGAAVTSAIGAGATWARPLSVKNAGPAGKIKRGVSLYSYQQAMMMNGMKLENMIEELSDIGAYGIEIMGQALVENYPYPSDQWISWWWELMDRYGTQPVCYTDFHDTWIQKSRPMSISENLEYLTRDFVIARKMGITRMRMLIGTPMDLIEAAIPVAEKMDIWMGIELHAPVKLKSIFVDRCVEIAEKHPQTFGFVPDFGMFQKFPRPYTRDRQIEQGILTRDAALLIEESLRNDIEKEEVAEKISRMKNSKPGDLEYLESAYATYSGCEDPRNLLPIMKYCKHIHGKFYEMSKGDEYYDTTVDYESVIPVLQEGGYEGYICSEYEGQRSMEIADVDEIDEIRRQHVMLKRMLGS